MQLSGIMTGFINLLTCIYSHTLAQPHIPSYTCLGGFISKFYLCPLVRYKTGTTFNSCRVTLQGHHPCKALSIQGFRVTVSGTGIQPVLTNACVQPPDIKASYST